MICSRCENVTMYANDLIQMWKDWEAAHAEQRKSIDQDIVTTENMMRNTAAIDCGCGEWVSPADILDGFDHVPPEQANE